MFRSFLFSSIVLGALLGLDGTGRCLASSSEVNIYSHRQPFLINPFLKEFTAQTGCLLYTSDAADE